MSKLTIIRGISGSGKSTWARSQRDAVVVSRDDLRLAFFGSDGPDYYEVPKTVLREREDFISTVEQEAIRRGLRAGKHVISDNTHTMMRYVNGVAAVGYAEGATVELKVFDVPLHTVLTRVKSRALLGGRDVPEAAIRRQHDQFQSSKNETLTAPVKPKPYAGTPGKPAAFLFDLDGTTFHMGDKRGPYDHNVEVDEPDKVVLDIVARFIESGLVAIAMSGREEVTRKATLTALEENGVVPDALFMRANKDMRKDSIIKTELFDEHVRDHYDVQFVLDDRNQVVDMWRVMGIKCLQVAPGEF